MKTATTAVVNKLKQGYDLQTSLRLIAEWNMNRYGTIQSITNGPAGSPTAEADPDNFPIESIADPLRPKAGIVKARAAVAGRVAGIGADGYVSKGYTGSPNGPRYVTVSPDSKYKYWSSPSQSAGSTYVVVTSAITGVQPTIIYTSSIWMNKIVVGIENSYAQPTAWTVEITTDGTNWTSVSTNPTIGSNGRVELYRQANGTWGTTVYRENPLQIRGIRLNVTSMNKSKVFFNLIELSPRLESDLSAYVVSYDSSFTMSDHSFVAPLGKASANTANVSLANFDNRFTNNNPSSLYYGLIDKNVEMRMDLGVSLDSYTTIPKTYEWIRQFTMITDEWGGEDQDTADLSLQDASSQLQEIKPLAVLYQSLTVAEIVWRLLDSIGFANYFVETVDADPTTLVPYFWTDGEKTVWEIISELAEQTQTAIYFDEYGILQIKTRNVALNLSKTVDWPLEGQKNGTTLANIVTLSHTNDFEANTVNVNYKETKVSAETKGVIPMEVVWEPDTDLVARCSNLTLAMTTASQSIRITPSEARYWPFTGVIQVEGEFMRYTAKGYQYYNAAGVLTNAYVSDDAERIALDKLNPNKSYMNFYNGYLWIGTANRGLWSSVPKAHAVDIAGYTTRVRTLNNTAFLWSGGWTHDKNLGRARMRTNSTFTGSTWYTASRGAEVDAPPNYYGTRLLFDPSGYTHGFAGLAMNLGTTGDAGYYVEMVQTNWFGTKPTDRNMTNELCFYVRYADGTIKRMGANNGKGVVLAVNRNVWYDLDVTANYNTVGGPTFTIYVNGINRMQVQVPTASKPATGNTGRWGLFTRGFTFAQFEYLYGTSATEGVTFDESDLYDRIRGDYVSTQLTKEWTYNTRTAYRLSGRTKVAYTQRYNQLFVDEFGAGVHEVKEMDVKFEKPVLHSRPYISNDAKAIIPEYNGSAFGAKFLIANAARQNAILSGNDAVSFGPDNPVEQKTLIYGRVINQGDEEKVTVKNDTAIRRRGESTLDIGGDWIQSKGTATAIGNWVTKHWAGGADELQVEIFANPLISLGDVVSINYTASNMTASTHKYFVVAVSNSYGEGLETTVTLRRAKI